MVGDVIDYDDTMRSSIITVGDGSETLLTGGVP